MIYYIYSIYYILYYIYHILYTIFYIYSIYRAYTIGYVLCIYINIYMYTYILYTIYYILYTLYYILYTLYYIDIVGSPANFSISYMDRTPLKYILEWENCSCFLNNSIVYAPGPYQGWVQSWCTIKNSMF